MVATIEGNGVDRYGVVTRVSRQLGIGVESLRAGVAQPETEGGKRAGLTNEERADLKQLRKENRELRRSNEMAVSAFCAAELDRPSRR